MNIQIYRFKEIIANIQKPEEDLLLPFVQHLDQDSAKKSPVPKPLLKSFCLPDQA
jgi:hypothetical protein